jgi:Flp pilus assembly protein TadG
MFSLSRNESGQALVEVAILLPVFILLLVGAIDFGRFAYDGILIGNAARAGVQYGALNLVTVTDAAGMQTAAVDDMQSIAGARATASAPYCACASAPSVINVSCTSTTVCSGSDHRLTYAKVVATGTFSPWIAYPGLPRSITITRTAVMQVSP